MSHNECPESDDCKERTMLLLAKVRTTVETILAYHGYSQAHPSPVFIRESKVKEYKGGCLAEYSTPSFSEENTLTLDNVKAFVESQEAVGQDSSGAEIFSSDSTAKDDFAYCLTSDPASYIEGMCATATTAADEPQALCIIQDLSSGPVIKGDVKTLVSYKRQTEKLISYLKDLEVEAAASDTINVFYENKKFLEDLLQGNEVLNFGTISSVKLCNEADLFLTELNKVFVPTFSSKISLKILEVLGASAEEETHIIEGFDTLVSSSDKSTFLCRVTNLNDQLVKLMAKYSSESLYHQITGIPLEPKPDLNVLCLYLLYNSWKKADLLLREIYFIREGHLQFTSLTKDTIRNLIPKAVKPIMACISRCYIHYDQNCLRDALIKRSALEYLKTYYDFPCQNKTVQDICFKEEICESCLMLEKLLDREICESYFIDLYSNIKKSEVPASHHWWAKFKLLLKQ